MKNLVFLFLLLSSPAYARLAGETVTPKNTKVGGLAFRVLITQQRDRLKIDVRVTQQDGGNSVIGKMDAKVSLGRKLMAPLAADLDDGTLSLQFFVSPDELGNVKLSITHVSPRPDSGVVAGCVYEIDLKSFAEKADSEKAPADDTVKDAPEHGP